ncbi:MAG: DUF411 domain-containing protein [Candidatus Woesearchaeota archaeon]
MKKQFMLISLIAALLLLQSCNQNITRNALKEINLKEHKIKMYKSMHCGCCGIYGEYLQNLGFDVEVTDLHDVAEIKEKHSIPQQMLSCHTMEVDGYFIEGHVPAEAIAKLLSEKPDIKGIALPGMPSGTPGMHGGKQGEWVIYALNKDGSTREFTRV